MPGKSARCPTCSEPRELLADELLPEDDLPCIDRWHEGAAARHALPPVTWGAGAGGSAVVSGGAGDTGATIRNAGDAQAVYGYGNMGVVPLPSVPREMFGEVRVEPLDTLRAEYERRVDRALVAQVEQNDPPGDCPRCGSTSWVGWRAGPDPDLPRRAQCVPCGKVYPIPVEREGDAS